MSRSRFAAVLAAGALALALTAAPARGDSPPPGTLTTQNLLDLISQMSATEEIGMVHGEGDPPNSAAAQADCAASAVGCVGEAGWIPGVKRLGIPPLRLTDGPAGIRLAHVETAMPAPVGLAATFDPSASQLYGKTVGDAGRATNQDVWLAPMINAVSYITGGRNFETLGEDPYLAGQLVASEVKGVQGEGMLAMIKHFIENDFENGRTSTSVKIDEQTLHETELQAFEAGVNAGAGAVMCSYNRINDVYGCANSHTLQDVLKGQLGFKGFVTSDWGATHRMSDLLHGLDMEQPGSANGTSNFSLAGLTAALQSGTPAVPATNDFPAEPAHTAADWKAALDGAVFRILNEMNQIGLLEGTAPGTHHTDGTPYVPPRPDLDSLKPQSFAAAQSLAEQSATLLKNSGGALPLTNGDLSGNGTVVLGPTAVAPYIDGGGSSHVTPYDPAMSPYDALLGKAPAGAKLSYVPGYDLDGVVTPSSALTAPDPAENYPNWTLTPADAAFAGQHGLLRQQITTAAVASGAQPVAAVRRRGRPARPDRRLHGREHASRRHRLALVGDAHRPEQPRRHGLAAEGLRGRPGELAAVRRRPGHRPAAREHRRLPRGTRLVLRRAGRDGALARPIAPGPPAGHLCGHPEPGPGHPPRPAADHGREPGADPAALGGPGRPGGVDRLRRVRRRGGRQGRDLRLRRGHRGPRPRQRPEQPGHGDRPAGLPGSADRRRGGRPAEHGGRAQHRRPGADALGLAGQVDPRDVVSRPGGRAGHGGCAAGQRQPRRAPAGVLPGRRHALPDV